MSEQPLQKEDKFRLPGEKHLKNIRQLTFGGNNAEAYWGFKGSKLVFQSDNKNWGASCDQIFYFDTEKDDLAKHMPNEISKNIGRTTCSFLCPEISPSFLHPLRPVGQDAPMFLSESRVENMFGQSIPVMNYTFLI